MLSSRSIDEAVAVAERMRQMVEATEILIPGEGTIERVTISAGVASAALREPAAVHTLLRNADRALYRAKANGRNCVCVEQPD